MTLRLAPVLFVHLCGTLGFSIALPFLVFLVADVGGAPWTYGVLGATYSAGQTMAAPVLGRWSDRVGRRRVLILCQAGTALAWILFFVALQLPREALGSFAGATVTLPLILLFFARALDGLTGGNISVANAYVADLTRDDREARQIAFGPMGMAASAGFTLGPAISGMLGSPDDPYTRPVIAAIAISVTGVVLCFRLREPDGRCPEGPPAPSTVSRVLGQQQRRCDRAPVRVRGSILLRPGIALLLAATFLLFLGFNLFYASFPLHATENIGWTTTEMGLFFSFLSASLFLAQGPILNAASRRVPRARLFGGGLLLVAVAFASFSAGHGAIVFCGAFLYALGNGLSWPTFQARTADAAPDAEQGALQGAIGSASSLASIVGLVAGGMLYPVLRGGVFLASGAVLVLVMLATPRLFVGSSADGGSRTP